MSRYTGPSCKRCRREGEKLFLKGERCYKDACALNRRAYPPGQHGQRRSKLTDYGVQFREKQKLRRMYGVSEKQFRNYFVKADKKPGVTGLLLLMYLENRLDTVVYRMGFASSIKEARQIVNHGHVNVNGRRVDIPSFQVKVNDNLEIRDRYKTNVRLIDSLKLVDKRNAPGWLDVDKEARKGTVTRLIESKEEIGLPVEENIIVEYYSK